MFPSVNSVQAFFFLWQLRSQKWVQDTAPAWLSTSSHTCSYLSGHMCALLPFFPPVKSWEFLLNLVWCEICKAAAIIQFPWQLYVEGKKWWEFSCRNQCFPSPLPCFGPSRWLHVVNQAVSEPQEQWPFFSPQEGTRRLLWGPAGAGLGPGLNSIPSHPIPRSCMATFKQ